jgi:UDP-2,3-diacylglucosamine pyrophosphatase LpxH
VKKIAFTFFALYGWSAFAQESQQHSIVMISDTQAPMWVEKLFLKQDHNEKATAILFDEIVKLKPENLFILGDVTSWSAKEKKWRAMDTYLSSCRNSGVTVTALLGNHDVMGSVKKGVRNFKKRFPKNTPTGYYQIVDSIAFVLLNSNFKKMKQTEIDVQQKWYKETLDSLDKNNGVKLIIVSCHHAPYSNSKIVGSSQEVQKHFVPFFINTGKCKLFITGHSHAFEHFIQSGKDFLVIGGGGGIHQPLSQERKDIQSDYKPEFHFLMITSHSKSLQIDSYSLKKDFSGFEKRHILDLPFVVSANSR